MDAYDTTQRIFLFRTILLDGILQLSDFKSTFEYSIMGRIVSEILDGFNSSLILIGGQNSNMSDIIQGGGNGLNLDDGMKDSRFH